MTLVGLERGTHHLLGALHGCEKVDPLSLILDISRFDTGLLEPSKHTRSRVGSWFDEIF